MNDTENASAGLRLRAKAHALLGDENFNPANDLTTKGVPPELILVAVLADHENMDRRPFYAPALMGRMAYALSLDEMVRIITDLDGAESILDAWQQISTEYWIRRSGGGDVARLDGLSMTSSERLQVKCRKLMTDPIPWVSLRDMSDMIALGHSMSTTLPPLPADEAEALMVCTIYQVHLSQTFDDFTDRYLNDDEEQTLDDVLEYLACGEMVSEGLMDVWKIIEERYFTDAQTKALARATD